MDGCPLPDDARRPGAVMVLVLALPLATLAAGIATLRVAGSGGLDVVGDPVRRTAQVQLVDHGADEAARSAGLSADARRVGHRIEVTLAGTDAPFLDLRLEHPVDARRDQRLRLARGDKGRYAADWPGDEAAWHLALWSSDGRWRLVGRWPRGGDGPVRLEPALAAR